MLLEGADPEDPRTRLLEKIERQTFRAAKIVNGLLNLSRPAAGAAGDRAPRRRQHRHHRRAGAARAPVRDAPHQGAPRAERRRRSSVLGHGAQAAAGVPQPVPQRQGRDAEGRLAVGRHARRRRPRSSPRWPTPARAFPTSTSRASTIRSSPPRRSARAPASASRSPTASSASTTARSTATASSDRARGSSWRFPPAPVERPAAARHEQLSQQGHRMRRTGSILVIDDEEIMREILEALLTREGYQVRLASSGDEGLELAQVDAVRRGDRRRDDARHGRHRHARRAEEARRRAAGADDHGVRVGRDGDRGDEARRLRLHHQAVQERRSAGRRPQRRRAAPAGGREHGAAAEPAGAVRRSSPASSAAARG